MIVLYSASWCGPCKSLKTTLDKYFDHDIEMVDIDDSPEEARMAGVRSVPMLVNTETKESLIGNVTKEQIEEFLNP